MAKVFVVAISYLFPLLYFTFRLDVLAAIVEYVSDLSEKLCVRILAHLMLVAEDDLVSYFLCGLSIFYMHIEFEGFAHLFIFLVL